MSSPNFCSYFADFNKNWVFLDFKKLIFLSGYIIGHTHTLHTTNNNAYEH